MCWPTRTNIFCWFTMCLLLFYVAHLVGYMWCSTWKSGTLWKLYIFPISFTMIMVNVSHVLCCFFDYFLEQVLQKTWILSIQGCHQPNSTYQHINQRTWPSLTAMMMMTWDTGTYFKVPPFILVCCITDLKYSNWQFYSHLQGCKFQAIE